MQATAVYKFNFGRRLASQLVAGAESRLKEQDFTPGSLYAVDANGGTVPGSDIAGRKKLVEFYVPIQESYPNGLVPVPGYRWMDDAVYNVVPPTAANPRGLAGLRLPTLRPEKQVAGYLNWLGNWFGDRAESMAGLRFDKVILDNAHLNQRITDTTAASNVFGIVFNVTPDFGIYANTTKSFAAAGTFTPTPDNDFPQPGTGISKEAGFKFDLFRHRVSGSLAYFDNQAQNEALQISGSQRNAVDPAGINGRNGGNGAVANVRSRGLELVLTAQPAKGWRLYFSAGTNDATVSADFRASRRFKIARSKWSVQFTVQNVFDVQTVERSLLDGGAIDTVQLSLPPRGYTLSTSTRF